jgi:hypothetical protein
MADASAVEDADAEAVAGADTDALGSSCVRSGDDTSGPGDVELRVSSRTS